MNNELNKKLAEWAGFKLLTELPYYGRYWQYPDEGQAPLDHIPSFTESLDACFRWLVPAWNRKENRTITTWIENVIFNFMSGNYIRCIIQQFDVDKDTVADAETPALALCKAIEKLIDGEKK